MLAILSFTTLIARRTTGVSANFRRLAGVGFGSALCPVRPAWLYGVKIEGSIVVFRSPTAASAAASTPASFSQTSFTIVRTPMPHLSLSMSVAKRKRHSPWAMPLLLVVRCWLLVENEQLTTVNQQLSLTPSTPLSPSPPLAPDRSPSPRESPAAPWPRRQTGTAPSPRLQSRRQRAKAPPPPSTPASRSPPATRPRATVEPNRPTPWQPLHRPPATLPGTCG